MIQGMAKDVRVISAERSPANNPCKEHHVGICVVNHTATLGLWVPEAGPRSGRCKPKLAGENVFQQKDDINNW